MNKSTNSNCSNTNYSETACGFVVFFNKEVSSMQMRNTNTNVGGYPATQVYDYLKNTLYNQLPSDLKSVIVNTRVISEASDGGTNYTTNDKLYLLSGTEATGENYYDQIYGYTRHLDYYYQSRDFTSSVSTDIWLRSANSQDTERFIIVGGPGILDSSLATASHAVVPAFRIG